MAKSRGGRGSNLSNRKTRKGAVHSTLLRSTEPRVRYDGHLKPVTEVLEGLGWSESKLVQGSRMFRYNGPTVQQDGQPVHVKPVGGSVYDWERAVKIERDAGRI